MADVQPRERSVGPFCAGCGADSKGNPAVYVPAPKQGGPFYYCGVCRPPVRFTGGAEPHVCTECNGSGVPSSNPRLLWCPKCGRAAFDEDVDA